MEERTFYLARLGEKENYKAHMCFTGKGDSLLQGHHFNWSEIKIFADSLRRKNRKLCKAHMCLTGERHSPLFASLIFTGQE